ncbi:MAG: heme exporter protein CcmB [Myxococcales bacterium]|nr:heme exporter protein CcmB [Myxococcales bacterium]MCB9736649.1 heme exporter protein CcmB [Deltaproteobacteria bacterium]
MSALRAAFLILRKDLLVELRTREVLATMVLFALLVVVIFAFAFNIDQDATQAVAPGILWVTLVFAGNLGTSRVFEGERAHGAMVGLMLTPGGPVAVYLAKVVGVLVFMLVMEIVIVPLTLMFVGITLPPEGIGVLALALFLGSVGFALIGTLFGAMLGDARMRELLVPLVVYPVVVPLLIAGVKLTGLAFGQGLAEDPADWLTMMVGFDLIFAGLAPWVFARVMVE